MYDPAGAAKMRPLSAKQKRSKDARRTCPECSALCDYIVYQRCEDCRQKQIAAQQDLYARTCHWCKRVSGAALGDDTRGWKACTPCRLRDAVRVRVEAEQQMVRDRTCRGWSSHHPCGVELFTEAEVVAARAAGTWKGVQLCPPCQDAMRQYEAEREEANRRYRAEAEEKDRQRAADLKAWAYAALTDPSVVILDTETTGLDDDARVVEVSIITTAGNVVLDTLVNPGQPIPEAATSIHGITDSMVAAAPTFTEVLGKLSAALDGKRCLIYNAPYDIGRLRFELTQHYQAVDNLEPARAADAWMDCMTFEDAMIPYSEWAGEWSEYWGDYAWQPLCGGHRALGDCRAVVDCLREMSGQGGSVAPQTA